MSRFNGAREAGSVWIQYSTAQVISTDYISDTIQHSTVRKFVPFARAKSQQKELPRELQQRCGRFLRSDPEGINTRGERPSNEGNLDLGARDSREAAEASFATKDTVSSISGCSDNILSDQVCHQMVQMAHATRMLWEL